MKNLIGSCLGLIVFFVILAIGNVESNVLDLPACDDESIVNPQSPLLHNGHRVYYVVSPLDSYNGDTVWAYCDYSRGYRVYKSFEREGEYKKGLVAEILGNFMYFGDNEAWLLDDDCGKIHICLSSAEMAGSDRKWLGEPLDIVLFYFNPVKNVWLKEGPPEDCDF